MLSLSWRVIIKCIELAFRHARGPCLWRFRMLWRKGVGRHFRMIVLQ